jgi:hypothetical protein
MGKRSFFRTSDDDAVFGLSTDGPTLIVTVGSGLTPKNIRLTDETALREIVLVVNEARKCQQPAANA